MTDQMVRFIVGKNGDFGETEKAQLAGILAHEIGHVRMRHGARILASSSLSAALAAALFGDFSSVATLPAVVMRLSYSREAEAEADGFAIALMQKNGIPMLPLAQLHERMEQRFMRRRREGKRLLAARRRPLHDQPSGLARACGQAARGGGAAATVKAEE